MSPGMMRRSQPLSNYSMMASIPSCLSCGGMLHERGPVILSMHFIVRFEPLPGKEGAFREELLRVIEITRTEPDCLGVRAFESIHEPRLFAIYSEWTDEAAFEHHVGLPHTVRFVEAAEKLLTHPIAGLRTREIGGGAG
jgi:quinol monooxygenase YgiN